jgi:hypothetical protein
MSTIVTRSGKGSPLSHVEVDANFSNLNTDKVQSGDTVAALTVTSATVVDLAVTGITSFDGAQGTAGQVLTSAGTGATPTWTTPSGGGSGTVTSVAATVPSVLSITGSPITTSGTLAIGYSGTALPIANGGTGATTVAEAFSDLTPLTLTTASATPLVLTNTSGYQQQITGSTNQTITLPSTATLAVGWSFLITNGTGFTVTVNTSTGANVYANSNIGSYRVWCISTANNNAASWSAGAETFSFETGTGSVVRATSPTIASATLTSPTATGTLNFTGSITNTIALGTTQQSGTLTIGGTSQTGTLTVGQSTVSQTTNIQAGATASGSTKAVNLGTGGLSGSTTNIAIGSTAGTSTTTVNGKFNIGTTTLGAGNSSTMKNRIINGDFYVAQRATSATLTAGGTIANGYATVDRFYGYCTGANVTMAQVSGTGNNRNLLQFTGAASVTAIGCGQRIEALNSYDLSGQTATLSAYIANSLLTTVTWTAYYATTTDTFGTLASPTRTQIATGTFTVTSTLTQYNAQISIPAAATTGVEIVFTVGAQTSGTWSLGLVQLEVGSSATGYEYRQYTTELSLCQRYCEIGRSPYFYANTLANTSFYLFDTFKVTKRASATVTTTSQWRYWSGGGASNYTPTLNGDVDMFLVLGTSLTAAQGLVDGNWIATAEL